MLELPRHLSWYSLEFFKANYDFIAYLGRVKSKCAVCLNKPLSKQRWGWWFQTLSRRWWRHCNVKMHTLVRNIFGMFAAVTMCFKIVDNATRTVVDILGNVWQPSWILKSLPTSKGTREAARLARDMLQRDLLSGNSVYVTGSCRARLLHINPCIDSFWGRCSSKKTEATARDSMCRAAIIS